MLGGAEAEAAGIATFKYRLLATLEESLEFAGLLLFLLFLLRRLRADHNEVSLRFASRRLARRPPHACPTGPTLTPAPACPATGLAAPPSPPLDREPPSPPPFPPH